MFFTKSRCRSTFFYDSVTENPCLEGLFVTVEMFFTKSRCRSTLFLRFDNGGTLFKRHFRYRKNAFIKIPLPFCFFSRFGNGIKQVIINQLCFVYRSSFRSSFLISPALRMTSQITRDITAGSTKHISTSPAQSIGVMAAFAPDATSATQPE